MRAVGYKSKRWLARIAQAAQSAESHRKWPCIIEDHAPCLPYVSGRIGKPCRTYRKQVPDAFFVWDVVLGNHAIGWDAGVIIAHIQDCLQHLHTPNT